MKVLAKTGFIVVAIILTTTSSLVLSKDYQQKLGDERIAIIKKLSPKWGYSKKINNFKNLVRICKSTAKGIRCTNTIASKVDNIVSSDSQDFRNVQINKAKICLVSARGTRCMNQTVGFSPNSQSEYLSAVAKKSSCRLSPRGSRCK